MPIISKNEIELEIKINSFCYFADQKFLEMNLAITYQFKVQVYGAANEY